MLTLSHVTSTTRSNASRQQGLTPLGNSQAFQAQGLKRISKKFKTRIARQGFSKSKTKNANAQQSNLTGDARDEFICLTLFGPAAAERQPSGAPATRSVAGGAAPVRQEFIRNSAGPVPENSKNWKCVSALTIECELCAHVQCCAHVQYYAHGHVMVPFLRPRRRSARKKGDHNMAWAQYYNSFTLTRALRARRARPPEVPEKACLGTPGFVIKM